MHSFNLNSFRQPKWNPTRRPAEAVQKLQIISYFWHSWGKACVMSSRFAEHSSSFFFTLLSPVDVLVAAVVLAVSLLWLQTCAVPFFRASSVNPKDHVVDQRQVLKQVVNQNWPHSTTISITLVPITQWAAARSCTRTLNARIERLKEEKLKETDCTELLFKYTGILIFSSSYQCCQYIHTQALCGVPQTTYRRREKHPLLPVAEVVEKINTCAIIVSEWNPVS